MQLRDNCETFGAFSEGFMAGMMTTDEHPSGKWTADAEHPAARFAADCTLQADICESLLAVADSLPGSLNATTIDVLTKLVPSTWAAHLALQGEAILPLIATRQQDDRGLHQRFAPLTRQHIEISSLNDELIECFDMVARGEKIENGMLGYLIRAAAERRREHVDWERILLEPLLPRALTPNERRAFSEWAVANPWPFEDFKALVIPGSFTQS